jgi:hypothetical protein
MYVYLFYELVGKRQIYAFKKDDKQKSLQTPNPNPNPNPNPKPNCSLVEPSIPWGFFLLSSH